MKVNNDTCFYICIFSVSSLCERKWQVTGQGHNNRNNSMRSLSVLKRCVTKEDRCLAHSGWTQARRAKVRSCVCWSACLGKLSELAWDKTLKVSLIISVAPACTCLDDPLQTKQGPETFGENSAEQAISCCEMKPKTHFCWIHSEDGAFFRDLVPKCNLPLWNIPASEFSGTLPPRELTTCYPINTLEIGGQGYFSLQVGNLSNVTSISWKKKTNKTKPRN